MFICSRSALFSFSLLFDKTALAIPKVAFYPYCLNANICVPISAYTSVRYLERKPFMSTYKATSKWPKPPMAHCWQRRKSFVLFQSLLNTHSTAFGTKGIRVYVRAFVNTNVGTLFCQRWHKHLCLYVL